MSTNNDLTASEILGWTQYLKNLLIATDVLLPTTPKQPKREVDYLGEIRNVVHKNK